jgi:hypothetical protein
MLVRRHLTSMFGMVALGAATGGVGALASWGFGGYNMLEAGSAIESHVDDLQRLANQFPELQLLLIEV